ncbi:putative transcriptional regulatory protein NarL [Posidoniimonas polymericola]|uniref:Putative transcriptional regulatory protein NarL n=1 Tax=Posidoniimonas polymericola TaxID=2528002 RepID=A0A5C5ZGD5_9BACT|nr:helix-turn-helix transcriptional regulator [Posidoniimonas polymericola]TWT85941.1 putative transcriptional regulatory protein NarL [Posidoniimonas polymericola]
MANFGAASGTAERLVPEDCDLFNDREWRAICDRLELSSRQAEVVVRVICGQGDRAIANSLGISCATVRAHLHRVFETLEVNDRVSLLVLVFRVLRSFDR